MVIFVFAQHFKAGLSAIQTTPSCLKIPCGLKDNWIYIDQATATAIRQARVASPLYNGLIGGRGGMGGLRQKHLQ